MLAQYRIAKADQPNQLVSIGFGAPPYAGVSIGIVDGGYGIPLGYGFLPIPYTLDFGITFLVYSRRPSEIPFATQTETYVLPPAGTVGEVVVVDLPQPDPAHVKPIITGLQFTELGDAAKVQITGLRFDGAVVEFNQLGHKVLVAPTTGTDTMIIAAVPPGFVSGLTQVRLKHPVTGKSNVAYLRPTGGLGAVASTGDGATLFQTEASANEIVRKFSLDGGFDTVFTPDLTRAYVTTKSHVAVIDTMAIRQVDVDLSTPEIDKIAIPGAWVHQIAIDPLGHFVFVAGPSATVWVIDARAGSETFNQILRTIDLPRARISISGVAVTADGKHLLVGTGTDPTSGNMTIYKLDPDNEPHLGDLSPGQWGMLEYDLSLPGIPHSITPSPDPERPEYVSFTYRYRVTSFSPFGSSSQPNMERIATFKLGAGTPTINTVSTKVAGGNLMSFATEYYSGNYTNILTPRDIALAPDLSYAYVGDWELHLVYGYGGMYGDKVGLIRDPFNLEGKQQYLGATTPIDDGLVTSVSLNNGGTRLYASYGGVGEVLVMNTAQLIAAGESLSGNPFVAERTPLDQVDGFNVHITPLTVLGLLQGMSTQNTPSLTVHDASGDDSRNTVFQDGALRVGYAMAGAGSGSVVLQVLKNGVVAASLGTFAETQANEKLINLDGLGLDPGNYEIRAKRGSNLSNRVAIRLLSSIDKKAGTFLADTFNYAGASDSGVVYFGNGGTDTINLGIAKADVKSLNGDLLSSYNPALNAGLSVEEQAIYRGSSFDYLRLTNGREIYFQGIEQLKFTDGTISLQVLPNDPLFPRQWNLTVTDTADAWRFTKGNSDVLLVSLDSGLPAVANAAVDDLNPGRIVYGLSVPDGTVTDQHGHQAISIYSAQANNGYRIAGINWNSTVRVEDLYDGIKFSLYGVQIFEVKTTLQQAINNAVAYANAHNKKRIVFQGGIQGESWLTSGGTLAQLQTQLTATADTAFFAVAAGNGTQPVAFPNPADLVQSGGVARLEGAFANVMAVGAVIANPASVFTTTTASLIQVGIHMLDNATAISDASYSNYGPNLTLMAPTDSPATMSNGTVTLNPGGGNAYAFNGTSAANPNMAGYASLVWSVNPDIKAGDLRNILIDTATDLGTAGVDNIFGYGMVNTGAAVRRAYALTRDKELAELYTSNAVIVAPGPVIRGPLTPSPYAPPPSFALPPAGFYGPIPLEPESDPSADGDVPNNQVTDAHQLTYESLGAALSEVESRWASVVGADTIADVIGKTQFTIGDLPETMLATTASLDGSSWQVVIDGDANGAGWFIDSTISQDEEFPTTVGGGVRIAESGGEADQRMDLLTVVAHELGHVLGLPDLAGDAYSSSLMADSLSSGTRKVPTHNDGVWTVVGPEWQYAVTEAENIVHTLHASAPRDVINGLFGVSNSDNSLFGWNTLGDATVENGVGSLREHSLFNSRFSQSIEIPSQVTSLRFTLDPEFANAASGIPDAFEFALIDAHTNMPLLATAAGLVGTDAIVNVQSDGTAYVGPNVTVAGLASSGGVIDLSQTHTFVIDLRGQTTDVLATLYFDMLGFGDLDSSVRIDNVILDGISAPALVVQLDPVFDTGAAADDDVTRLASIDLIGTTEPDLLVSLDIDGDGFDDGDVTADQNGQYRFPSLSLTEGSNAFRVRTANAMGETIQSVAIDLDTAPPAAVMNTPIPGQVTASDLGYVDVTWSDVGGSDMLLTTIDKNDLTVTGVTVTGAEVVAGKVRYSYDGTLPEGQVEVTFAAGAVSDVAGNESEAATQSFTVDRQGPTGTMVTPSADATTTADLGYVEIQWTDAGAAGVDPISIDKNDVTITGVTVDHIEVRGNGLIRYWYNDDSDALVQGSVSVSTVAGAVLDRVANSSSEFANVFTFAPAQDEPQDVTDRVTIDLYGRQYNRRTGAYGFYAAITNDSADELAYPIRLLLTELGPTGTTVLNASGTLNDGTSYFDFEGTGTLAPGETSAAVVIGIQPPPHTLYTFVPRALAVVIGSGGTGGELILVPAIAAATSPQPTFQNNIDRFDVNSDGKVSAGDALSIINHLHRGSDLIAADLAAVIGVDASKWVDVNGDGKASSLDALNVINELGRRAVSVATQAVQGEQIRNGNEKKTVLDEVYASLTDGDANPLVADFADQSVKLLGSRTRDDEDSPEWSAGFCRKIEKCRHWSRVGTYLAKRRSRLTIQDGRIAGFSDAACETRPFLLATKDTPCRGATAPSTLVPVQTIQFASGTRQKTGVRFCRPIGVGSEPGCGRYRTAPQQTCRNGDSGPPVDGPF